MRQNKRIRRCFLLLGVVLCSVSFPGQASAMRDAAENMAYEDAKDWEEEYTDTDTRRGTLAVRAETFQGFHGIVQAVFQNTNGGRRWMAELNGEPEYAANLELPPGVYRMAGLWAVSDGREFHCEARVEEILVEDGKVSMFLIDVLPGSLYRLPDEETEVEEPVTGEVKREVGQREAAQDEEKKNETFIGILGMAACVVCLFYVLKRKREGG